MGGGAQAVARRGQDPLVPGTMVLQPRKRTVINAYIIVENLCEASKLQFMLHSRSFLDFTTAKISMILSIVIHLKKFFSIIKMQKSQTWCCVKDDHK